jgi:cytochrome c peroxidase
MLKSIYTFSLIFLVVIIGQALTSSSKRTIVSPPDEGELNLPEIPFDYSPEPPLHIFDFILGWGINNDALNSIDDYIATLGRVLFYDVRLSDDNSLSCASCHKQALAFSDDKAFSNGIGENLTTRNTMPLNDLGWQVGQSFFWDFRAFGLQDAVIQPILATHELGKQMPDLITKIEAAEVYAPLFVNAFGDTGVTEDRIAYALAEFINSMVSFNTRYDQSIQGLITLSDSEIAGQNLFDNNCSFCHITPHFGVTDPMGFFPGGNNGLDSVFSDLGMGGWTGDDFLHGVFRAPSLRNVEVTAPYMHDGRFETLEEVIQFYSEEVIPNDQSMFNWIFGEDFTGYDFSEAEKADLLAFLKVLTDENLLTDDRWSNPWESISTAVSTPELQNISVYPNPTDDQLIIELNNSEGIMYSISIYDARGQLVESINTNDSQLTFDRKKLPPGIYELQATNGNKQRTFQIIFK